MRRKTSAWLSRSGLVRRAVVLVATAAVTVALTTAGVAVAAVGDHGGGKSEPCNFNSEQCMRIGGTDSWFNGTTINLNYSHKWFCGDHALSQASTGCEIGAATTVEPSSGKVVSPIYVMTPIGFKPPNLQCPRLGNCIDHPHRVDASRVFGPSAKNALLPPHSHIIVDREGALSSWWPVIVIGVTNQRAWNQIAAGKSYATVQHVRSDHPGWVTPNVPSNIYLFFQAVPGGDNDANAF